MTMLQTNDDFQLLLVLSHEASNIFEHEKPSAYRLVQAGLIAWRPRPSELIEYYLTEAGLKLMLGFAAEVSKIIASAKAVEAVEASPVVKNRLGHWTGISA